MTHPIARSGTVKSDEELPAHMARVSDRWASLNGGPSGAALQSKLSSIGSRMAVEKRAKAHATAQHAKSAQGKVFWLRVDADVVLDAVAGLSACKSGCAHCCNIGVAISQDEAEVIGKAIGRKVARPARERLLAAADLVAGQGASDAQAKLKKQRDWLQDAYYGMPCTFLSAKGSCTIYEARPLACRWQINLDSDALLCELMPQGHPQARVPYLDMSNMQLAYAMAFGRSPVADLRDWFPVTTK